MKWWRDDVSPFVPSPYVFFWDQTSLERYVLCMMSPLDNDTCFGQCVPYDPSITGGPGLRGG
jgi:hypothetical protein